MWLLNMKTLQENAPSQNREGKWLLEGVVVHSISNKENGKIHRAICAKQPSKEGEEPSYSYPALRRRIKSVSGVCVGGSKGGGNLERFRQPKGLLKKKDENSVVTTKNARARAANNNGVGRERESQSYNPKSQGNTVRGRRSRRGESKGQLRLPKRHQLTIVSEEEAGRREGLFARMGGRDKLPMARELASIGMCFPANGGKSRRRPSRPEA